MFFRRQINGHKSLGLQKLKSGKSTIPVGAQHVAPYVAPSKSAPADPVSKRNLRLPWALAAATTIAFAGISFVHFSQAPIERPVSKWSFAPSALTPDRQPVAVSPNGRHIAYVAGSGDAKLWVRDLDQLEPRELVGTEGARQPFWSPDSRFIGFAAGGEVKKISVQGGPAITLCPVPGADFVMGGSWSPDGESIAFGAVASGEIRPFEVPAQGGQSRLLFEPEENPRGSGRGSGLGIPHFLPAEAEARSMLLRVGGRRGPHDIVLKNFETGESLVLARGDGAVYSPSGHIVYQSQGGLWALPFSLDTLEATGEAFPIVENSSYPSVAMDGTLVSLGSSITATGPVQLVWRDRAGERVGEIGQPQETIRYPALSPDGRSVAVASSESGNSDIWVHEVERPLKRRLTFDEGLDAHPQWSPSGREITFMSQRSGTQGIFRRAADGTGEAELLVGTEANERPWDWSRDGNYFVYTAEAAEGNRDLWHLKREEDGEGFESLEFLATPFNETAPSLSPGGDLLAYCSNQSEEEQVYVRPFPSGGGQWVVSTNGGCQPRWSHDGKELFYVEDDTLMAVEVKTTPVFAAGVTTPLFSDPYLRSAGRNQDQVMYDVSADGRFVLVTPEESERADEEQADIQVIENWYEEFRDRERPND